MDINGSTIIFVFILLIYQNEIIAQNTPTKTDNIITKYISLHTRTIHKTDDVFIILIKPIIDLKQIHASINKRTYGPTVWLRVSGVSKQKM